MQSKITVRIVTEIKCRFAGAVVLHFLLDPLLQAWVGQRRVVRVQFINKQVVRRLQPPEVASADYADVSFYHPWTICFFVWPNLVADWCQNGMWFTWNQTCVRQSHLRTDSSCWQVETGKQLMFCAIFLSSCNHDIFHKTQHILYSELNDAILHIFTTCVCSRHGKVRTQLEWVEQVLAGMGGVFYVFPKSNGCLDKANTND